MMYVKFILVATVLIATISTAYALNLKPGLNKVSYKSEGERVVAHVFLSANHVRGEKLPAVVFSPPVTSIKEQTAGLYAEKLSAQGFVTLVFDPRGFGESEGQEVLLHPYRYAEDIMNSVSFLRTLDEVDSKNVFNVGICAGAGYAAYATAFDSRVKAVAIITPYLTSSGDFVNAFGGKIDILRAKLMSGTGKARQSLFEKGDDILYKMVPTTEEEIKTARAIGIGMRDYYLPGQPGEHPRWKNQLALSSGAAVLSFDIMHWTKWFDPVPVFMAVGTEAISKDGAYAFYNAINGPKEILELKGAGHFEMYYKDKYVSRITKGMDKFFKELVKQ